MTPTQQLSPQQSDSNISQTASTDASSSGIHPGIDERGSNQPNGHGSNLADGHGSNRPNGHGSNLANGHGSKQQNGHSSNGIDSQISWAQKLQRFLKANAWQIAIMLCGTAVALSYHFVFGHPKTTLIYDARSYLWTSSIFAKFFIELSHLHWAPELILDPKFQQHVVTDGPIYTSFIGGVFALFQSVPEAKDYYKVEIIQSILHGFTCGFVYLISLRLLDSKLPGSVPDSSASDTGIACSARARVGAVTSALLWAFYPAANLASGFMYTEAFVIFVVSAFIWSAVSSNASRSRDFLCGVCAGLVFLLKPALIPATLLSCAARLFFSPKKAAAFSTIVVALALTIAPWALYTHFVCGKMQITTARFAGYNLAMGSDPEVEGRLVIPITPLTNFFSDEKQGIYFVASQWKYNTAESLQITAKKLTRFLTFPWNDFRHKFFGMDASQQRLIHLALLFLGLVGCTLAAITRKVDRDAMPILVVLTFMWTPLTYLLFEANSRYGFSVMPFYAVFAGFLIAHLVAPDVRKHWKPLALSVVSGAVLTTVILQSANWASAGSSVETTIKLEPQQTLVSQIDLNKVKEPAGPYEAVILVDGERSIETARLNFNGHELNQKLVHLRYLDAGIYDGYYVSKEIAHLMQAEAEDFRQWRVARIPKEWIDWSGKNQIKIAAQSVGCTVYGDSAQVPERLPSFRHNCPNRMVNDVSGYECRVPLLRPSRSVALNSFIEGPAAAEVKGSSRVRIAIVTDSLRGKKKQDPVATFAGTASVSAPETLLCTETLTSDRFPPVMRSATGDGTVHISRFVVDHVAPNIEIKLPQPVSGDNIYRLELTGSMQSKKPGKVSALLSNGVFAVVSKVPPHMECGPEWKTFKLEDRMPVRLLKTTPEAQPSIVLSLYPGQWLSESGYGGSKASSDAQFRDLKLSVWSTKQLNLAGKQVFVY